MLRFLAGVALGALAALGIQALRQRPGGLEQALRDMPTRLTEMQERANALLAESRRILQETRQELQSTIEALRQAAEAQAERLRRSVTRPEGEGQPPTG